MIKRWTPVRVHDRWATRSVVRCTLVLALLGMFAVPAAAQTEHLSILGDKLRAELAAIAEEVPGVMGIAVVDLTSGERFGVNETLIFPQGSSIKVPILVELYRQAYEGRLELDDRVTIRSGDQTGGSGILRHFGDGSSALSLRDLAILMIVLSDNTATNLLIDRVGMDRVNRTMKELGFANTRLQRRMIRPQDSAAGRENISTPTEAADLMVRIARCELPMSPGLCQDLRSILEMPKEVPGSIPENVAVAWKGGSITGVRAGWGIVGLAGRPYVVAAMVNYGDGPTAVEAIGRVNDAAFSYFSRLAGATPYGTRVPLRYLSTSSPQNRD